MIFSYTVEEVDRIFMSLAHDEKAAALVKKMDRVCWNVKACFMLYYLPMFLAEKGYHQDEVLRSMFNVLWGNYHIKAYIGGKLSTPVQGASILTAVKFEAHGEFVWFIVDIELLNAFCNSAAHILGIPVFEGLYEPEDDDEDIVPEGIEELKKMTFEELMQLFDEDDE